MRRHGSGSEVKWVAGAAAGGITVALMLHAALMAGEPDRDRSWQGFAAEGGGDGADEPPGAVSR